MRDTRALEILVVDDDLKHLAEAQQFFEPLREKGAINVTYKRTLAEAEDALAANDFDGVIADVLFPMGFGPDENGKRIEDLSRILRSVIDPLGAGISSRLWVCYLSSIKKWVEGEAEPPSGLYVATMATDMGMPVVFCTDVYHRLDRNYRLYSLGLVKRWADSITPRPSMKHTDKRLDSRREWIGAFRDAFEELKSRINSHYSQTPENAYALTASA